MEKISTYKEYEKWLKRQKKKLSGKELEEIKKLQKQSLSLWRKIVIKNAGKQCEAVEPNGKRCKKTKHLNAHHIESFSTNKWLRCDPRNGVAFCSAHHKFGRLSAHKSFIFMYLFMLCRRNKDLTYLLENYNKKQELTKEFLEQTIQNLLPIKGYYKPVLTRRKHEYILER